jgi:hypothetical protein
MNTLDIDRPHQALYSTSHPLAKRLTSLDCGEQVLTGRIIAVTDAFAERFSPFAAGPIHEVYSKDRESESHEVCWDGETVAFRVEALPYPGLSLDVIEVFRLEGEVLAEANT